MGENHLSDACFRRESSDVIQCQVLGLYVDFHCIKLLGRERQTAAPPSS